MFLLRIYINFLSFICPKFAAKIVFNNFQKVRLKTPKARELPFYQKTKPFTIKLEKDKLHCYELGNLTEKLVVMVHGWDSNAGSLSLFAYALAEKGYHVVTFDLLAHHKSTKRYTNLYETKIALKALLKKLNPTEPFSIIGHSFGASAISYTLSETSYKVDKIILLSSNNRIIDVFRGYQKMFGFNERVFQQAKLYIDTIIHENFSEMSTVDKLKRINFNKLLIIHDIKDKIIPFHNAATIHKETANSILIPFERIGHYRMLWNEDVVNETVQFITE